MYIVAIHDSCYFDEDDCLHIFTVQTISVSTAIFIALKELANKYKPDMDAEELVDFISTTDDRSITTKFVQM